MRNYTWFMLVLLGLTLTVLPSAHAQGPQDKVPPKVIIMHTSFVDGDELDLRVFFTVRDELGKPVPPNTIAGAALEYGGQEIVKGKLEETETEIKIALVLDASGSMGPNIDDVRNAAARAIDQAPDSAQFAVFTFSTLTSDESYEPGLPFTSDKERVKQYIREQYDAIPNGNTCLYTAVYKAVEFLDANLKGADRRAVIAFTDGKDTGGPNGGQCSDRSIGEVIQRATPSDDSLTPLYMIGLCGASNCSNVDKSVLDSIADKTNAVAAYGNRGQIAAAFFDIIDDIKNQKAFQVSITPCDESQAILHVEVIGIESSIRGIVPLRTNKCYGPSALAEVTEFQEGENLYRFNLRVDNQSTVTMEKMLLTVLSPNNTSVYTQTVQKTVSPRDDAEYPTEISSLKFTVDGEYTLRVFGETADGTNFEDKTDPKRPRKFIGEHRFKHASGAAIAVKIGAQPQVDFTQETLSIPEVTITDKRQLLKDQENFIRYKVKILDNDDIPIYESDFGDFDPEESSIVIPFSQLPQKVIPTKTDEKYSIIVQIFAPSIPKDTEAISDPVAFVFPVLEEPGFFARWGSWILGFMLMIVVGMAGMYLWRNWAPRKKRAIPMPFNPATSRVEVPVAEAPRAPSKSGNGGGAPAPAARARPEPRLRIKITQTPDPSQKREQIISYFPCVIGRGETNFSIGGDSSISRKHAEITVHGDDFYITDLDSANGVFIDDNRQQAGRPIRLDGRTMVRIGQFTYLELEPRTAHPAVAR